MSIQTQKSNVLENPSDVSLGIEIAYNAVKGTIGGAGRNVLIEVGEYPYHIATNDGATIIQALQSNDEGIKIGLDLMKELTDRSNSNSGDGSTTTTVLLHALITEVNKSGVSNIDLISLIPSIEAKIDAQTRLITEDDVYNVALTSGEDEELADILSKIYKHIGKDGIIHLSGSLIGKSSYKLIDGVRFTSTGYLSKELVTEGNKAVYENPTILVTKRKLNSIAEINPLITTLIGKGKKELVIFTDDMDNGVAQTLIANHKDPKVDFKILIIKAPVMFKSYVFEDFAKVVGANIVEDVTGLTYKNLSLTDLGTCEKLIVDREDTLIIGGADITEHIAELSQYDDTDSKLRLSWLTTKTSILNVGANNESELSYKRLKMEDAINACRTALRTGIVAGGGLCLANIAWGMDGTDVGIIIREAFRAPLRQIIANAGSDVISNEIAGSLGFDAKSKTLVNMFDVGIVDSSLIIKNAVRNAMSLAHTILSTDTVIYKPKEVKVEQSQMPLPPMM